MMDQVQIRPMRSEDLLQVVHLCHEWGYPTTVEDLLPQFREITALSDHALYVAELGQEVIGGWVYVHQKRAFGSRSCAEVGGLVVDSRFRQLGLGRRLIDCAEQWARVHGYDVVRLRSGTKREEAHVFYPKIGYERIKSQHVYQKRLLESSSDVDR